jgi:hypothetical protein
MPVGCEVAMETLSNDPLFTVRTVERLSRADIIAVAAGRIAAVRVPVWLSADESTQVVKALDAEDFDTYDPVRVVPRVAKFGPGVNDHRSGGRLLPSYWPAAEQAWKDWSRVRTGCDPIARCTENLREAWAGDVAVGASGGKAMFAGIVREINDGLQVHFDDLLREYAEPLFGVDVVSQLAFNLYLHVPGQGGETVIWRRRWRPADEAHAIPHGYGYRESVVDGAESLKLKPMTGEAFLFDPRNYHTVTPAVGDRRVSLGFFVALAPDGKLLLWS